MSQRKMLDRNQNDLESAISGRRVGHKNDRYRIRGREFKVPLPSKSRERLKRGRKREAETNRRQGTQREKQRKNRAKPERSFSCRHFSRSSLEGSSSTSLLSQRHFFVIICCVV